MYYKFFLVVLQKITRFFRKIKDFICYHKYEIDHVFDIKIDDFNIKMSFGNYKLTHNIIERIEGRRDQIFMAVTRTLVRKSDKVLYLGACFGYFTLIMSKMVGEGGKVVCIEGTPNNFKILKNNLKLNDTKNVDPYNVFITSKSSTVNFKPTDETMYRVADELEGGITATQEIGAVEIKTVVLSDFLKEINFTPSIIFIDIEGFEVEVFEDFNQGYFHDNRPTIFFEIHDRFYKSDKNLKYILNLLRNNNYLLRKIGTNYLCIPN